VILLLTLAGIVLLLLAGFNVRARHFAPEWLGLACLALVFYHHNLPTT
jgi:hypothetical protein